MTWRERIVKRIEETPEIRTALAKYQGRPAVFDTVWPRDGDNGWAENKAYPRIVLKFFSGRKGRPRMRAELYADITASGSAGTVETMISAMSERLSGVIIKAEDRGDTCISLTEAPPRETAAINSAAVEGIICCPTEFVVMEYPVQDTTDPDPVLALNRKLKEIYPEAVVLWYDVPEEVTDITGSASACYCRLRKAESEKNSSSAAVKWMKCKADISVFSCDRNTAAKMAASISDRLLEEEEIAMADGSPMFIKNVEFHPDRDGFRKSQIIVKAVYGLLRHPEKKHRLTGVNTSWKGE
ncbi:hypothetical protein [Clostridium sp. AM58-1XD]|uniref:hypothetical protein n=1 Tax=Clostridium sp. AM58-1XD TaxID=2292307 RepID=UPI000E47AC97|nr:hypothetical protein [Clostridium sp. AM58-1XD]RGY95386.1 hypothetical protein DXA13_19395 [Clostridium sp. AM58-1XD]